jgi:hypothetical protein
MFQARSRGGFNSLWNYFPIRGFLVIVLVNILKKRRKPSECTTTPSTFSFMRKRKCSMENRKSVVYLLDTNTMTKKLLRVIFLQWIETSSAPWFQVCENVDTNDHFGTSTNFPLIILKHYWSLIIFLHAILFLVCWFNQAMANPPPWNRLSRPFYNLWNIVFWRKIY